MLACLHLFAEECRALSAGRSEGLSAVCVCSMDDASSISSGEISDAVAGVSTDDNITVGSSLSAHSYADRAALASQRAAVLHMGSVTLQTAAARRHAATDRGTLTAATGRSLAAGGAVFIRRSNQAVVTDLKARTLRSGTAVAIDDPARCLVTVTSSSSSSGGSGVVKQKKDSETNTDNSALMMLAQRSRLAAEYSSAAAAAGRVSLTPRRLATESTPRSSSLGRTQSDSRARDPSSELQSSRKHAMSETDEACTYCSSSVGRTGQLSRCRADDQQTAAAAAAASYHSDGLSASGGQYSMSTHSQTHTHTPVTSYSHR